MQDVLKHVVVLIAEDSAIIADDLQYAVELAGGRVLGPAATVREARFLLESQMAHAALLDVNLVDGNTIALAETLVERGVPVVFYSGRGLPGEFVSRHPDIPVFSKPTLPSTLVRALREQIQAIRPRAIAQTHSETVDD